ncbi:MAG: hypothetical protein KBC69_00280 [Candidatus Magasanikbacteria bacterium]|nr:hypothetical protein [Candidatus Magasanikbacteria bacterium]
MPAQRKRRNKKIVLGRHHLMAAALVLVLVGYVGLLFPGGSSAVRISPRRANYFLGWDIPASKIPELAKWDLLILDMETQVNSQAALRKIKELNPDIILLAYITPQEIKTDAATSYSMMRRKLVSGIEQNWYLTDIQNNKISFWPGTWMLNVADTAPQINGIRFNQYLAQFVNREIFSTGLWNGVFYDNAWKEVKWIAGDRVDFNKDSVPDSDIDGHWQQGMRQLYQETRRLAGDRFIIMGNTNNDAYKNDLNGAMLESFPNAGSWKETMRLYVSNQQGGPLPRFMVINANTGNKGTETSNLKKVRFGLASTLMLDGYYSYDFGDQNHNQTWWYDEYDVELGKPLGTALSLNNKPQFEEDVWRREYENGIALVNATAQSQDIDLGGEYEKLTGTQDKNINNGAIVSQLSLPAKDGVIMLRTFQTLKNLVFGNGNFVRFFDVKGNRARNGLFIYEEGILGGAQIYYGDLDADGQEEKIIVTGQKLQIFNSSNQIWFEGFPFANYKGELRIAIGKIGGARTDSIVVTQNKGGQAVIYNYHGGIVKENIFPLGKTYKAGLSVAIAEDAVVAPDKNGQIVVARGNGARPEVIIYNNNFSKINKRFFVDTARLKGDLGVAVGNVTGDAQKEIIVSYDFGKYKQIKIYTIAGKLLSQFKVSSSFTTGPVTVGAVDVDFDGRDEVVLMNKQ